MIRLIRFSLAFVLIGFSLKAAAYQVHIEGSLLSFNAKTVKLKQENGKEILVPRSLVPHIDGYIPGKAWLRVAVPVSQLLDANPDKAKALKLKK